MAYFQSMLAVYVLHTRIYMKPALVFSSSIAAVPLVAVATWIATQSSSSEPVAYVSIGVVLMAMWQTAAFFTGWSLAEEFNLGTLDHTLVSRTPLVLVMFAKSVASLTLALTPSAVAFLVALAVSHELIDVALPLQLIVSMGFAISSIVVVGFIFTPLFVLVKGRGGGMNAILPIGTAFSGFLYPISQLSTETQILAHFLPTSWAMDGVIRSVREGESTLRIAGDWGAALGLSVVFLVCTYLLLRKVEDRVRVTGSLGSF